MKTVLGLFNTFTEADRAYGKLLDAGLSQEQVSIITLEETARGYLKDGVDETAQGATTGAVAGSLVGLLAGISAITIPGVGPIITAGTLGSVLASMGIGAGVGAAGGGLVGALMDEDITHEEATAYAEAVTSGGTLLSVRVGDDQEDRIRNIFDGAGAVDVRSRQ